MKKIKNKKSLAFILGIFFVGVISLTIAYFYNGTSLTNIFTTKSYGNQVIETFTSPSNWIPGNETPKTVLVKNKGEVSQAVRISLSENWTSEKGEELSGYQKRVKAALINLDNVDDWIEVEENGKTYYYYYKALAGGEQTSKFLKSVTFNPDIDLDVKCYDGVIRLDENINNDDGYYSSCESSGYGYDNAEYNLKITIETAQFNKYQEVWNTDYVIGTEPTLKPYNRVKAANYLMQMSDELDANFDIDNASEDEIKDRLKEINDLSYGSSENDEIKMYRYIGPNPNNYVFFNCTDDTDTDTCEYWRIIGVFQITDENDETDYRMKIMRDEALNDKKYWNPYSSSSTNNWNNSTIDTYLNNDYYSTLSTTAKNMIKPTIYYTSVLSYSGTNNYGDTYNIYNGERRGSTFVRRKMSLIYPSDYFFTYAADDDSTCFDDPYNCNASRNSWMYKNYTYLNDPFWTMTSKSKQESYYNAMYIANNGKLMSDNIFANKNVIPVAYLSSGVEFVSGNGKEGNPYVLELNNYNLTIENNEIFTVPNSAESGQLVSFNYDTDKYQLLSYKMNGIEMNEDTFRMPNEDVNITDIQYKYLYHNIYNEDSDIVLPSTAREGSVITLSSENYGVTSFKLNGEVIVGDSFTMPGEDATITDINKIEHIIVESTHNPYPNSLNYQVFYENTFEDATSITVELTYQTESTSYDWVYLYTDSSTIYNNQKFGGLTKTTTTITIPSNYIKIVFKTDGSVNNYYGFKAKIKPNY